jgi:hypothetical protein
MVVAGTVIATSGAGGAIQPAAMVVTHNAKSFTVVDLKATTKATGTPAVAERRGTA